MNYDPLYAISGERPQSSSDYYITAANIIRDLSDTQEVRNQIWRYGFNIFRT